MLEATWFRDNTQQSNTSRVNIIQRTSFFAQVLQAIVFIVLPSLPHSSATATTLMSYYIQSNYSTVITCQIFSVRVYVCLYILHICLCVCSWMCASVYVCICTCMNTQTYTLQLYKALFLLASICEQTLVDNLVNIPISHFITKYTPLQSISLRIVLLLHTLLKTIYFILVWNKKNIIKVWFSTVFLKLGSFRMCRLYGEWLPEEILKVLSFEKHGFRTPTASPD